MKAKNENHSQKMMQQMLEIRNKAQQVLEKARNQADSKCNHATRKLHKAQQVLEKAQNQADSKCNNAEKKLYKIREEITLLKGEKHNFLQNLKSADDIYP